MRRATAHLHTSIPHARGTTHSCHNTSGDGKVQTKRYARQCGGQRKIKRINTGRGTNERREKEDRRVGSRSRRKTPKKRRNNGKIKMRNERENRKEKERERERGGWVGDEQL